MREVVVVVASASHSRRVVVVLRMVVLVEVDDVDDVLVDVVLVAPEVVDVGEVVDVVDDVEVVDDVGVEDDVELDVDVPEARGRCPAGQIVVEVVDDVLLEEDEVWAPAGAAVAKSTSANRRPTVQRTTRPGRQGYIIGVA